MELNLNNIVMLLAVILLFILVLRLIFGSIKKIVGLLINSVLGAVGLLIVNYFGASFGVTIGINLFTALIAGVFGIPGVIFLIIFQLFM